MSCRKVYKSFLVARCPSQCYRNTTTRFKGTINSWHQTLDNGRVATLTEYGGKRLSERIVFSRTEAAKKDLIVHFTGQTTRQKIEFCTSDLEIRKSRLSKKCLNVHIANGGHEQGSQKKLWKLVWPRSVLGPARSFPNFCSLIVSRSGGSNISIGSGDHIEIGERNRHCAIWDSVHYYI